MADASSFVGLFLGSGCAQAACQVVHVPLFIETFLRSRPFHCVHVICKCSLLQLFIAFDIGEHFSYSSSCSVPYKAFMAWKKNNGEWNKQISSAVAIVPVEFTFSTSTFPHILSFIRRNQATVCFILPRAPRVYFIAEFQSACITVFEQENERKKKRDYFSKGI